MLEVSDGSDLTQELRDADAAHGLGGDDFEGDDAAESDVAGEVDGAHAALAQLGVDEVAIGDGAAEVAIGPGRRFGIDPGSVRRGAVPETVERGLRRRSNLSL